jgi:hypothetical protein
MKRIPRTSMWPDLVYRAERMDDERRAHAFSGMVQKIQEKFSNKLIELSKNSENELVEHLETCTDCRKRVADLVRSGVRFNSRVLSAAKIDVLN